MNQQTPDGILILCLRLGAFLCFAGWGWAHLYWEVSYGDLLWHDTTYELVSRFGVSWDEFVGTGANDGFVQKWAARVGWLYVACAVLTLTVRSGAWFQMAAILGGSGLLAILSYTKYLASQCQLPTLLEHGGQIMMPLLLVLGLAVGVRHRGTVMTAVLALITTFAGHGSYALGLWPTPGNFYAMISVILHVEYDTAKAILRVAGVLDFIVCVGVFIPHMRRSCALYATAWGFVTAIARPVAGMSLSLNFWGADQFLHEALLRTPHFLIPLYLFLVWAHEPSEVSHHLLCCLDRYRRQRSAKESEPTRRPDHPGGAKKRCHLFCSLYGARRDA